MPSSRRRNAPIGRLEVGGAGRAEQDRVGRAGEALGFCEAQRVGHRGPSFGGSSARGPTAPENQETTFVCSGRKAVPSAVPPSFGGVPHSDRRRPVDRLDRRCPVTLALCAGAYLSSAARCRLAFGPVAPGSIRRRRHPGSHQPPGLWIGARRVLVPIKARIRDVARSLGSSVATRQARPDVEAADPPPDDRQPREAAEDLETDDEHDEEPGHRQRERRDLPREAVECRRQPGVEADRRPRAVIVGRGWASPKSSARRDHGPPDRAATGSVDGAAPATAGPFAPPDRRRCRSTGIAARSRGGRRRRGRSWLTLSGRRRWVAGSRPVSGSGRASRRVATALARWERRAGSLATGVGTGARQPASAGASPSAKALPSGRPRSRRGRPPTGRRRQWRDT